MLAPGLTNLFHEQLAAEAQASAGYLALACWAEHHHYPGAAAYFYAASADESAHMLTFLKYLLAEGILPQLPAVPAPVASVTAYADLFQQNLAMEQAVTHRVHALMEAALTAKDYPTAEFLREFVTEQHHAEQQAQEWIDKLNLVGTDPRSIYLIDQELLRRSMAAQAGR